MVKIRIGIIGGTGLDNPDIIENRKENVISTPYGIAEVVQGSVAGVECVS
jgi:5'-methylthioadenosine phosphorylase